jgi:hypothetical protein
MIQQFGPVGAIQGIPESQKRGIVFKVRMQVRIDQDVGVGEADGPSRKRLSNEFESEF